MARKKNYRAALKSRNGERFRIRVADDSTGQHLTDHLWMTAGKWFADIREGDIISFDARVGEYLKGYFGRRDDVCVPESVDWRVERPTNVKRHAQCQ